MDISYVNLFLSSAFSSSHLMAPALIFFLFLARMLPIIALSPFFGSRVLPHPVKIAFAVTLFVIFLPHLLLVSSEPLSFNTYTLALFAKEIFIGYIIGFIMSIPFTIVQTAGMLVDHQRGGASLMVNDPTIQNQSSPLGTLFNLVLIYIFFQINGPFLFIDAIITSYTIIPPDRFFNPNFFLQGTDFWTMQINLLNTAMKLAAQLATPALMAILMTDVFLGITNRLAQQVQITFLGLPLKSLLGLGVICLGWKLLTLQMAKESYSWLETVNNMIIMFAGTATPK